MTSENALITESTALETFCRRVSGRSFITVDTEFLREKTYWPRLCLVQIGAGDEAWCVDPLAEGLDLAPLFEVFRDPSILKVFHAARQDLEIFFNLMEDFPRPLFDTQVAAMVCGFGDSVGYETLAAKLANARIDKSMRFTDWGRRPLTEKQIRYALADVTHLRDVYEALARALEDSGRAHWLTEEMALLTAPERYRIDPDDAWRRVKIRTRSPRVLAIARELAKWREIEARTRDIPRQRVLRDETLVEIATLAPSSVEQLDRARGLSRGRAEGAVGAAILKAVKIALALPADQTPQPPGRKDVPQGVGPITDLLKVLLKMRCEENGVAQKLVASGTDLEAIAMNDAAGVMALSGWRREVFGADALALKHGRLALCLSKDGDRVEAVEIED